ncbi:MAG: CrcB family protein [Myxococcales bacterium FL481]|nr:MAG: CrcB family protein [Myxococcales bacterium FL481]
MRACVASLMAFPSPTVAMGVFLAGGLGAVFRYGLAAVLDSAVGPRVPQAGVMVCNVVGCLAIGFVAVAVTSPAWRAVVMAGLLGGLTTYSAFALFSTQALLDGRWVQFIGHLGAQLVSGVVAVGAGGWLARRMLG